MQTIFPADLHTEISKEIERVREQMVSLGGRLGFMHSEVQRCSQQLDDLLIKYYEMDKIAKHTFSP